MQKLVRLLVLALAAFALNAQARTSVPVQNLENVVATAATGGPASPAQIKAAITSAAAARGWLVSDLGPGRAAATVHVRGKHTVVVDITYGGGKFSVKYKDSVNMNYEDGVIHPHYNKWVQLLVDTIRAELARQA
jgi:hypothetical protein